MYYSAVDLATGNEFLLKYPILIVLHLNEQIIEFRFDTLRRIFVPERQEQTFYSDLISKLGLPFHIARQEFLANYRR